MLGQTDESEHLLDARIHFFERLVGLFVQPVADVLAHRERVEQRAFLKDHAKVVADFHQLGLGEPIDALAVDRHRAAVRLQQADDDLERRRLAGAAGAQNDLRAPLHHVEADVLEDDLVVERELHVIEDDNRAVVGRHQ